MASPNQPKQMSSRLLTMKFMQRSVAKASTAQPPTPTGPPSKRMRYSTGASTPGTPSDQELMRAAMAAEEKKRQAAVDKEAAAVGETRWFLSFKDPVEINKKPESMKVVTAGFATLDADDDDSEEESRPVGRMTFGNFTKPSDVARAKPDESSSDDSDSDSSEADGEEDDDPTSMLIREEARKAKKKAKEAAKARTAKRGNEDIDLDNITTISGSAGPNFGDSRKCFICGKPGHLNSSCPNRRRGSMGGRGAGGRGRGRRDRR